MADTTFVKRTIEPYVRGWLEKQFPGHKFAEKAVPLRGGGKYKFDAVSEDETVVGNILSNRAKTRTGRENSGAVLKALKDIQYLTKLRRKVQPVLVFTDKDFQELMLRRGSRVEVRKIRTLVCPLPDHLQDKLVRVLDSASHEQRAAGEGA
jgi:predicted nuclease of predicted toxin-antitoxin system